MYEARQHKEKVSRTIGGGSGTRQNAKSEKGYSAIIQKKAEVVINYKGINIVRNGDLHYIEKGMIFGGKVYRHMSPKSSRLKLAKSFFETLYQSDDLFQNTQQRLKILQNQLTGFEYFTEHLGKQFSGNAESNRKLTREEYDSILIAASQSGNVLSDNLIDKELEALAEDYMYAYLSRHAGNEGQFINTLRTGQLTLDAMFMPSYIQRRIGETAEKLNIDPFVILNLMNSRINPVMIQKAMAVIANAADDAFLKNKWLGPTTFSGAPSPIYYVQ